MQYTGVVGAFNCQGGGWCREERRNKCASQYSHAVTSTVSAKDVEWKQGSNASPISVDGVEVFAMYSFKEKKLVLSKPSDEFQISLEPFNFELITVSPVTVLGKKRIPFAPIGLANMLNSGGAIHSLDFDSDSYSDSVQVGVKGAGEMRVFAAEKPVSCRVNEIDVAFVYEKQMIVVQVPWPNSTGLSIINYQF